MSVYFLVLLFGGVLSLGAVVILTSETLWGLWLIVLAVYVVIQRGAPSRLAPEHARQVASVSMLMQLVAVAGAAMVSRYAGPWLIGFGIAANLGVVMANERRMPVLNGDTDNACYAVCRDDMRCLALGDIFEVTPVRGRELAISPGDALEVIGLWVLAFELLLN